MGIREYARHRKDLGLVGGTQTAVQYAMKSGRITEAVVRVTGEPFPKIDSERANQLWAERSATNERIDRKEGGDHARVNKAATTERDQPAAAREGAAAGTIQDLADTQDDGADLDSATYAAARAAKERANARLAQLELAEREGSLVNGEAVAATWEKIIKTSATKVLALPSKIRARMPKLTAADVSVIELLVRETLTELSLGEI